MMTKKLDWAPNRPNPRESTDEARADLIREYRCNIEEAPLTIDPIGHLRMLKKKVEDEMLLTTSEVQSLIRAINNAIDHILDQRLSEIE